MKLVNLFEMWHEGDFVVLKYDDTPENQKIIGKRAKVIKATTQKSAPYWMTVEVDNEEYVVRGSDCSKG